MTIPYIGFDNQTLAKQDKVYIGEYILCPQCKGAHILEGDDNGGDFLLFYKCDEVIYLGAVSNSLITGIKADISGEL